MGRPTTLLEGLCGHALSIGAQSIEVEYNDRHEWVFANKRDTRIRIAKYKSSGAHAKELRGNRTCARPARSRMSVNMDRMCGIARFSLSATGR